MAAGLVCLAAMAAGGVDALAAPRYIIVHGGGLQGLVLLDDWPANGDLVATVDASERSLVEQRDARPVFELAIFWTPPDLAGRSAASLRPDEASQRGRFYPEFQSLPAEVELAAVPGIGPRRAAVVSQRSLDYLAARGVPVKLDAFIPGVTPAPDIVVTEFPGRPSGDAGSVLSSLFVIIAGGVGAAAVIGGGLWWRARRRPRGFSMRR
jgi:hypothetical protein